MSQESRERQNTTKQIANAQLMFNILGVLGFVGLIPFVERFLNHILPDEVAGPIVGLQAA